MKKLTGPALLTLALMVHIGLTIATEESYTFSSTDYEFNHGAVEVFHGENLSSPTFTNTTSYNGASSITRFGLFSIED